MKRMKNILKHVSKLFINRVVLKKNKNTILWLLTALFISLSFSSCENEVFFEQKYLVENNTNKEFLVCFEYGYPNIDIKMINTIMPNEVNHILYSKIRLIPESAIGTSDFNFWIYNRIDSVYCKVNRDELDKRTQGNATEERTDSKTDLIKYIFSVQINESLTVKMTKNTHLTDSIFRLKK